MDKEALRFTVGFGVALVGIGLPMTGNWIPHFVGLGIVVVGLGFIFWPAIVALKHGHLGLWYVPLRRAAQISFENTEGLFVGNSVVKMFDTEDERLSYFFHSFHVQGLPMFAKTPPSSRRRQIPQGEMRSLIPMDRTDNLAFNTSSRVVAYRDAAIRRSDLWRALNHLAKIDKNTDV